MISEVESKDGIVDVEGVEKPEDDGSGLLSKNTKYNVKIITIKASNPKIDITVLNLGLK